MSGTTEEIYESSYRRTEFALPGLLGVMAALGIALVATFRFVADGNTQVTVVLSILGVTVVAIVAVAVAAFRVHRWTIEADGVRVEERPKVPLTGIRRRAKVAFANIAALREVESGFDARIEIAARDGRHYRLAQVHDIPGSRPGMFLPNKESLDAFAAAIRAAAERAGRPLPPTVQALSFWNRPVGLGIQVAMLAVTLAAAGGVGWSIWEDGLPNMYYRNQREALLIVLLLPVGVGYLLYKSLKRRWAVLAATPLK